MNCNPKNFLLSFQREYLLKLIFGDLKLRHRKKATKSLYVFIPGRGSEDVKEIRAYCLGPHTYTSYMTHYARVLMSLIEPLVRQKYHVVCYNSRGNGRSTGWSSLTGFSEAEDLKAVVNWLISQTSDIRSVVILVSLLKPLLLSILSSFVVPCRGIHTVRSSPRCILSFLPLKRRTFCFLTHLAHGPG